jgi:flagellar hook assembly protein FlgD
VLEDFQLVGAYPNPFNPTTTIVYHIAKSTDVKLSVYNILGELVTELVNGKQPAGKYKIEWNAGKFSSGMYFYALQVGGKQQIVRGILLK